MRSSMSFCRATAVPRLQAMKDCSDRVREDRYCGRRKGIFSAPRENSRTSSNNACDACDTRWRCRLAWGVPLE